MSPALEEYDLLIVSDLHLSEGRHPATKKLSLNEDFFFDEEFARFLDFHVHRVPERPPGKKWHLIINGDFLDFLQVTSIEGAPPELSRDPDRPDYGLGCGAAETVFKLKIILDGHWLFFEALAEFIAAGNIVTIGKGNHDVEFHYPEVREAFRSELRQLYAKKLDRENDSGKAHKLAKLTDEAIRFLDWFYYEKGLLWVEHGNQYDKLNCFKYWLAPLLPTKVPGLARSRAGDVDLPWGSLFVRYLFNRVETAVPYADNIKPQSKFIAWFISYQPLLAVHFLLRHGTYMLAKMARAWRRVPPADYANREAQHRKRLGELAGEWQIPEAHLQYLDSPSLRAASVLKEPRGWWRLYGWLTRQWRFVVPVVVVLLLLPQLSFLAPLFDWLDRFPAVHYWLTTTAGPFVRKAVSVFRWLAAISAAVAILLPRLRSLGKVRLKPKKKLSELARRAGPIRERLNVRYVIMGHTHDTDLQSLGPNGQEYFNTGTWTKVFRPEEERLISDESELVFVQAMRQANGLKLKLLKWDDPANQPRLVKLFQ